MPWSPMDKLQFVSAQFALQETHYRDHEAAADRWIITEGAVAIGRLYVRRQPRWWALLEIALKPAAQRGGIGAALIGWVAEDAAVARAGVELQVGLDNMRAIALYRRLGFVEAPPHGPTRLRMRRARQRR